MSFQRRFLLPLLLPLVILAGCGSGTQSLPSGQRKLIAEADPICASASAKRAEANSKLGTVTSLSSPTVLKSIAETAPGVSAYESEAVAKLRQLSAPASLSSDWQTMLAGLQKLAKATGQLGVYAKEKNVAAGEKLLASSKVTREQLLVIAGRDGFSHCGRAD
jgi:hypothetical protein